MNHLKDMFLVGLHEPLRTTLALTDFSQHTIEQVVTFVLALDRAHHNNSFAMGILQTALAMTEETSSDKHCNARYVPNLATPLLIVPHDHTTSSAIQGSIRWSNVNTTC